MKIAKPILIILRGLVYLLSLGLSFLDIRAYFTESTLPLGLGPMKSTLLLLTLWTLCWILERTIKDKLIYLNLAVRGVLVLAICFVGSTSFWKLLILLCAIDLLLCRKQEIWKLRQGLIVLIGLCLFGIQIYFSIYSWNTESTFYNWVIAQQYYLFTICLFPFILLPYYKVWNKIGEKIKKKA